MGTLFGTDGLRGEANLFPATVEVALGLGKAVAKTLQCDGKKPRVVIGKDTRLSCYMFENALVAGLNSMGVDTLVVGPLPTPGVAFITRAYRADAGIMISASHNPYYDNGIKVFTGNGFKLPDEVEQELENMILAQDFGPPPQKDHLGKNKRIDSSDGRYIEYVKSSFPRGKKLQGMKLFIDCANGATYRVAPAVLWELDAETVVVGDQPNGTNINKECGSMYPEVAQEGVLKHGADVGMTFDGDGDRVLLVDEKGKLVDGDTILAIAAIDLHERGLLNNAAVVGTVMTNAGVIDYLKGQGISTHIAQVGDRYVLEKMLQQGLHLGGEQSGHMIFLDYNTTGDGLITALQVLSILQRTGKKLSELADPVTKYPQCLVNVPVHEKVPLENLPGVQRVIHEVEKGLQGAGKVLVRYSGTENLCRVLVEGKGEVEKVAHLIAKEIEREIGVCVESRAT